MLRKFIHVLLFVVFANTLVYSSNLLYVIASPSLILRKTPDLLGKSIIYIPFNSEVKIIEEKKEETIINNLKGKWAKIDYNDKQGWVFNPYLSSIPLNKKVWKKVFDIHKKAQNINSNEDVNRLFSEVVDLELFADLNKEFKYFSNYSFEHNSFYNLDYLSSKIFPINAVIKEQSVLLSLDMSFFKSKSKVGTNIYTFFELCEKGYVGLSNKLYSGKNIRPVWHTSLEAQKKPWYFKIEAENILNKWKKILPNLDGKYKAISQNTIKRLEWVLSRCKKDKKECI